MPGSTVEVGACRVDGHFVVPAGVTLHGAGPAMTTLTGSGTVLQLAAGATVDGLAVQNGSGHGIVALDGGTVTIRHVTVTSTHARAAIGILNATSATLSDVTVTGPVTPANAVDVAYPPTSTGTALYGIVLSNVASAMLDHVNATGFAAGGVATAASTVTWNDGSASGNLGVGVWIDGGRATLARITIDGTLRGFRGVPSFGFASGNGAEVATTALTVTNTESGFGLIHDGGAITHMGLVASGHPAGAVIAQRTASFTLGGATNLHDNRFAGLIAIEAGGLHVSDTTVSGTRTALSTSPPFGALRVGDGLQIVHPMPGTVLTGVTAMDNDRAGLLIDNGGVATDVFSIASLSVAASGTAFGCVMQNGTPLAGWDMNVTRTGVAAVNDAMFTGGQDVVGIIAPTDLPVASSLGGIIAPTD